MLIDTSHNRWAIATLALAIVATVVYVPYTRASLNGPSGGSAMGLVFGGVGFALMIYAGILGARRKVPTWRVGRATTWMRGHLWLGLASYLLILYHAGFQWGGPLTIVLMSLFTIVIVSGIYGVVLQQFLPRTMLMRLPLETVYEQIDAIVTQLRAEADTLVADAAGPLPVEEAVSTEGRAGGGLGHGQVLVRPTLRPRQVATSPLPEAVALKDTYLNQIRPYLATELPKNGRLSSPLERHALFGHLRTVLPGMLHETVSELEAIYEERRQLAQQKKLHHWLHGWLLAHVPLSMALLLLSVAHAIVSVRY